jgi:rare lipoprotein A
MLTHRPVIAFAVLALVWSSTALAQQPYTFAGRAAYYDVGYKEKTTSGAPYDPNKFTAAHRTLPFGTRVKVTDDKTGRSVVVTINDRGPFNDNRVIDLSLAAAKAIGMIERGIITVHAVVQ